MKIKVWTLASDDDNGTQAAVFATERLAYEAFTAAVFPDASDDDYDRAYSLLGVATLSLDFSALDEFLQESKGSLDTYSVEEHEIEVALPTGVIP